MAILVILVVATAIAAPWATIDIFEAGRKLAGWMTVLVTVVCHVTVWYLMASNKEATFFLAAPWAAYEFILTIIPAGIVEMEDEKKKAAAEAAANKG